MLKGDAEEVDLLTFRDKAHELFPRSLKEYAVKDMQVNELVYPVESVPDKISSHNLEKTPEFTDRLTGIKGQYLIFENRVINLRKYAGYHVNFDFLSS